MQKTKVKFLIEKESENEVFAYFPYLFADRNNNRLSYAHVGQHSACCEEYANECKQAPKTLFEPLLNELISIGYNLEILK